ncbi:TrkH family potassium uptake protein [Ovoidimarina sediminis]|uniref:TrkH family potassium uptake protein n=1 Tax=Ovoidimarina sediminis TaxID=3079856 RepID=UPI00290DC828|nr:TrkH family potassium uptake protein [Rhodophyticola sp. MJ-SS7]MDU8943867.1 TrkH family potassium uptake protein [Rhodophyticola sp. MJ-SS7]
MIDLRPVGYVVGLLVAALGVTMLVPMGMDLLAGNDHWQVFLESALITALVGGLIALACANGVSQRLSIQQTFLLTTGVWLMLPVFGAIPFALGATEARFVNAFFESMSGMTTTGSTVFVGLERLPPGLLLWRSMLQWFGGIGIIVVAMVFLPELRIGGMQMFRSEAFDTMGKILPRATAIAGQISAIYLVLTVACMLAYLGTGMSAFDALNLAMTTVSTGGFAPSDASMGAYAGIAEYVATLFMFLASLPFVRYVQLVAGTARPLVSDTQVRALIGTVVVSVTVLVIYRLMTSEADFASTFREALFNLTSIITGTGFASVDYQLWGPLAVTVFFFIGLVGGCAGSTCCSVKIFRYQILFSSIKAQIQRIHSPHGIFTPRFDGRTVSDDILSSVMAFFVMFIVSLGIFAVALGATGLDFITSVSGAATALANVGPGLGPQIGPAGNFAGLNDAAKWILIGAMLTGRLEIMGVYAILTINFWRTS